MPMVCEATTKYFRQEKVNNITKERGLITNKARIYVSTFQNLV